MVLPCFSRLACAFFLVICFFESHVAFAARPNCKNNSIEKIDALALVKADNKPIESLDALTSGVYSLALAQGVRPGCGGGGKSSDQEFLGFNNRTCTTSLSPKSTAGPVMRGVSKSMMWREWMVRVVGEDDTDKNNSTSKKLVSFQAFIHPDVEDKAKCLGYMSSFYDNPEYQWTCSIPPYGDGLFLNVTEADTSGDMANGDSQIWSVEAVGGGDQRPGEFVLIAANKPEVCARALAASDCNALATLVEYPLGDSTGRNAYTSWKFIKQYDISPTEPSPSPAPTPSPVVPTPLPGNPSFIPGPTIAAPSYTSSGFIRVTVKDVGGNERCSVESITISYAGNTIGSVPKTKTVDASKAGLASEGLLLSLQVKGYNSIYAVGHAQVAVRLPTYPTSYQCSTQSLEA